MNACFAATDVVYTSLLKRAIRSSWILMKKIGQIYRPVHKSWRVLMRHICMPYRPLMIFTAERAHVRRTRRSFKAPGRKRTRRRFSPQVAHRATRSPSVIRHTFIPPHFAAATHRHYDRPMTPEHKHWHGNERKYADLASDMIPTAESLQDTMAR